MNHYQYQDLRDCAMKPLSQYLDTDAAYQTSALVDEMFGPVAVLERERNLAVNFSACRDLSLLERRAARLLAVVSNHRGITWWRETETPDGSAPCAPLEPWQEKALCDQTREAASAYAALLPEREAAALLALVPVAAAPPRILKKSAMLAMYAAEWPTIEADIREAARNGLDAAKTDKKGMWYADKAIEWARSRGKWLEPVQGHPIAAAWRGDSKKHTIGK